MPTHPTNRIILANSFFAIDDLIAIVLLPTRSGSNRMPAYQYVLTIIFALIAAAPVAFFSRLIF